MERYPGVRGHKNVRSILEAVEASGGTVLVEPDPTCAPYELQVRHSDGSVQDLVCYAFTANKYAQGGRPSNEHRFQIKYGSDFTRAHPIYVDSTLSKTTLMFGVHHEHEILIAVDPAAHNPTWFSSSVEFKTPELSSAVVLGWHSWERDRMKRGRRRAGPDDAEGESKTTEILTAFAPRNFLAFAQFERAAYGLDAGERLLLAEKVAERLGDSEALHELLEIPSANAPASHSLLNQLGLSADELVETLQSRFRLLSAVRGSVAEVHLERLLRSIGGISNVERLDLDGQPDFRILYKDRPFRIECKNVLRKTMGGRARVDFQKTRAAKDNPCSRYYESSQFEVLAACLHPVTERWEFRFCATDGMPRHKKCAGRLSERVVVSGESWRASLTDLLDDVINHLSEN